MCVSVCVEGGGGGCVSVYVCVFVCVNTSVSVSLSNLLLRIHLYMWVTYVTVQCSMLHYSALRCSTYLLFGCVQNRVAATAAYIGTRGGRRRETGGACRCLEMRPYLVLLFASNEGILEK